MREVVALATQERVQCIDITRHVGAVVIRSGVREGLCHVYCPHTTAGILVQENADPDVIRDLLTTLARLAPAQGDYRHAEGNSDAHIKAMLVGTGQWVPIADGRLALGTWQGLFLCEFDGPRTRRVVVTIVPTER